MLDIQKSSSLVNQTPSILSSLDSQYRISTHWIAQNASKRLKAVHEDVNRVLPKMVDTFDHETDARGYTTNMWLPLADAIILVSTYEGERAQKARDFIREAINYFIFQRPLVEEDNIRLRNENQDLAKRVPKISIPKRKKDQAFDTLVFTQTLFFEDLPIPSFMTEIKSVLQSEHNEMQKEFASIIHGNRVLNGLQTKLEERLTLALEHLKTKMGVTIDLEKMLAHVFGGERRSVK